MPSGQLHGLQPLPEVIPLTPRLSGMFGRRIASLPGPTRIALLIAAADGTGDIATILRAAAWLQLPQDALDPAEGSGLIQTGDGTIRFLHPLVRSPLSEAAPLSHRQRVHAALASALPGEEHADRRVWHQAMAAVAGDEEVAAALDASARRAQRRAGHASAATAFQRAADLSLDESRRVMRLASAAQAACDAGQPDRARELIGRVLLNADGPLYARMLHLREVIEARRGDMAGAVATLTEAAGISTDPSLIIEMLAEAAQAAAEAGDPATAVTLGAHARKVRADSRRAEFIKAVVTGFASIFAAGPWPREPHDSPLLAPPRPPWTSWPRPARSRTRSPSTPTSATTPASPAMSCRDRAAQDLGRFRGVAVRGPAPWLSLVAGSPRGEGRGRR